MSADFQFKRSKAKVTTHQTSKNGWKTQR